MDRVLWHQSGVNRNGEPFVQLLMDDQVVCQLTAEEARDHARNILEAAEASEQDAFMMEFAQKDIGGSHEEAINLIRLFRAYREARGKKGPPSDPKEFVVTDRHQKPEKPRG